MLCGMRNGYDVCGYLSALVLVTVLCCPQVLGNGYNYDDYRDLDMDDQYEQLPNALSSSSDVTENIEDEEPSDLISMVKRYYRGWGHPTRYPWKRLPKRICFQQRCKRDKDCCYKWNICDRSAKVCRDCWYAQRCRSERDCCANYPYCLRTYRRVGKTYHRSGKCVAKL